MDKQIEMAYCQKDDIRFGEIYFKKGSFYEIKRIHDLLFFKGEKNNFIQFENYTKNEYFDEFFRLVVSSNYATPIKNNEKHMHKKRA